MLIPPAWAIDGFLPTATTATVPGFTLRILGTGFVAGEHFTWTPPNGAPVDVGGTFINSGEYRVFIQAQQVATAGTAFVTEIDVDGTTYSPRPYVVNPAPRIDQTNLAANKFPDATRNVTYDFQNSATGGTLPLVWSITGSLPAGLQLAAGTGRITGTPTAAGTSSVRLTVTDASNVSHFLDLGITVQETAGPLTITSSSPLTGAKRGLPYLQTLVATGGTPPYQWSISAGTIPGLVLVTATGQIIGVPTAAGPYTFTARVSDAASGSATKAFTLPITLPTVTCEVVPRNQLLPAHRPTNHLGSTPAYPNHSVLVNVIAEGTAPPSAQITMTATQQAFGPAGALPNNVTATGATSANGTAQFPVNPPEGGSQNQTNFTATGSVGTVPFTCEGSIVTGSGAMNGPVEVLLSAESAVAYFRQVHDDVGLLVERFQAEFNDLFANDPNFRERATRVFANLQQPIEDTALGMTPRSVDQSDSEDFLWILKRLERSRNPELRAAAEELHRQFDKSYFPQLLPADRPAVNVIRKSDAARFGGTGKPPVEFEPNQGQADAAVRYLARTPGYSAYLASRQVMFVPPHVSSLVIPPTAIPMEFGAAANPMMQPEDLRDGQSHYLRGADEKAWLTGIAHYGRVRYASVYPGVDLLFRGEGKELEFDFIVAPGANPNTIRLRFPEAERISVSSSGALAVQHRFGSLQLQPPNVYQEVAGKRVQTEGKFTVARNQEVHFRLGPYDKTKPLVIDPVVEYATYLGGAGDDGAAQIALDPQGNVYVTGGTQSVDFPLIKSATPGAAIEMIDVFVTKLNANGQLIYSTFIGGSNNDSGMGIAVDAQGNAYVTGVTRSANFPRVQAVQNKCAAGTQNDRLDAFVLKLNAAGSGIVYSTCLGGSGFDIARAIALGPDGSAHITGVTNSIDFPVRNAYQSAASSADGNSALDFLGAEAFVAKLNPAGSVWTYATYLGGTGGDIATAIAVDAAGNAWVGGATYSSNFPTRLPMQSTRKGPSDGFVAGFDPNGANLIASTFLGGTSDDMILGLALDASGAAYVTGITGSPDFPLLNAAQKTFGDPKQLGMDAFAAKLVSGGTALSYSTFLGGSGLDMGMAITVGPDGSAFITGETSSVDFPVAGGLAPPPANGEDVFLAKLSPDGAALRYGGTFGGSHDDGATGVAVNAAGTAFLTGLTFSRDLGVTYGSVQPNLTGKSDALLVRVSSASGVSSLRIVNSGSYSGSAIAPGSIASVGGEALATSTASVSPAVTPVGGVVVRVKDSAGIERDAAIYYVSPGLINFVVPPATALGVAEITVLNAGVAKARGTIRIALVAPSFFSANASGQGPAAAVATFVKGAEQTHSLTFQCPTLCVNTPLRVNEAGQTVFVSLYGTGFPASGSHRVTATIGGVSVTVPYAGPQFTIVGLDQVNLGPLPASLAGKGTVDVVVTVDDVPSNTVTLAIE
jgi:uncharacterized protein (TIGR03437 family)